MALGTCLAVLAMHIILYYMYHVNTYHVLDWILLTLTRPFYRLAGSHDGRMRAGAWLRRDPELRRLAAARNVK